MKTFYKLIYPLIFTFMSIAGFGQITYVNPNASGAGDGTSWADAYTVLDDALEATDAGEIWIAGGTYTPASIELDTFNTFGVLSAISIYGGFAGTEASKDDRIEGENTTILSGDIMGNDIDNNFTTNREDNVFHVMTIFGPEGSTVNIDGITFMGGQTRAESPNDDYTWRGGAIYTLANVNITNCNFNNNFARSGSAVYLRQGQMGLNSGSSIDNCVFEKNLCVSQAAGLFVAEVDDVTVTNTTFRSNTTNRGALYPIFCNNFTVDNCTFSNNISTTPDNFGGAMFIWNSTGIVKDCSFESNNTGNGAGLYMDGREMATSIASNFVFENCSFVGNSTSDFGGAGLRSFMASYTVRDCDFTGNFGDNGGAIFSSGDNQEVHIMGCNFEGNTATFGGSQACYGNNTFYSLSNNTYTGNAALTSGGAIINGFEAQVTIDSCDFTANLAGFGGALYNQNDTTAVNILNSTFTLNSVGDGNGGAINIGGPVMMTIDNCLFRDNIGGFGGAINGNQGNDVDQIEGFLNISNSTILLNTASMQGAGISLVDLDLNMTSCVVATNFNTGVGSGGGLSLNTTGNRASQFSITNSTVVDNFAVLGAGISTFEEDGTSECTLTLQNTLLSNQGFNYEVEMGDATVSSLGGNLSTDATLESFLTNTNDQNNVVDLKFINSANYDFNIADDSPAINNGIAAGAPEFDILGNPRVGEPDAGAYENQDPLSVEIIENNNQLTMAPNPVRTITNVSLHNEWTGLLGISIMDMNGKLVFNEMNLKVGNEWNYPLNTEHLNMGKYILTVQSGNQKIATSFIKI